MLKKIIILLVVILTCGILIFFYKLLHKNMLPKKVGYNIEKKVANPINIPDINNKLFNIKQLKGKVFLLNFFGSWCLACKVEHKFLLKYKKVIDIYGVAFDEPNKQNVLDFLNIYANPYKQVAIDNMGESIINYGVTGAPETFLINKNGYIIYKIVGVLSPAIWKNKLLPLIKQERSK